MSPTAAAGFWSYVHADDEAGAGAILTLASKLRAEYRLLTSEDIEIFVDRQIGWGDEWEKRIHTEIFGATFFFPIVTPSFFKSAACAEELLSFASKTRDTALESLILPIYWVTVSELEAEEVGDPLMQIVKSRQWRDLREVRNEDPSSSSYKKAVTGLAEELSRRVEEISEVPEVASVALGDHTDTQPGAAAIDEDAPGILDQLADGEGAVDRLTVLMEALAEEINLTADLTTSATAEFEKPNVQQAGFAGRVRVVEAYSKKLAAPARAIADKGNEFTREIELADRLNSILIDSLEQTECDEIDEGEREYLESIVELTETAAEAMEGFREMESAVKSTAEFSRSLRAPAKDITSGLRAVIVGDELIQRWGQRAEAILKRCPAPA